MHAEVMVMVMVMVANDDDAQRGARSVLVNEGREVVVMMVVVVVVVGVWQGGSRQQER